MPGTQGYHTRKGRKYSLWQMAEQAWKSPGYEALRYTEPVSLPGFSDKYGRPMKHGLIVLAHGKIPDLLDVLGQFNERFSAYVHVDRKARVSPSDLQALAASPRVRYTSRRYRVNWGGLNIVLAILHLAREAMKDKELEYLHMITGTDRIIVKPSAFVAYFEAHRGKEFLSHFALPTRFWRNGGLDRLVYYDPMDLFDVRSPREKKLRDLLLHVQQRLGLRRSIPASFPPLFGGSMSWSLSRGLIEHLLDHIAENPSYLKRFAHTHCPDEIAMQTLIMNSPFAANVVNNNLRYIDWSRMKSPHPYMLDLANWDAMLTSGDLLARKIDRPFSDALIERLREHVQEDPER